MIRMIFGPTLLFLTIAAQASDLSCTARPGGGLPVDHAQAVTACDGEGVDPACVVELIGSHIDQGQAISACQAGVDSSCVSTLISFSELPSEAIRSCLN